MRSRGEFRGAVVRGAGYAVGRGLVRAAAGGVHLALVLVLLWALWRHLPQVMEFVCEWAGRVGR
jgi:hypothetical protein